jgi:hypothetical protein
MSQAGIISLSSTPGGVVNTVTGTHGVTAAPNTGNVVVSGVNATTTTVGVASFNPTEFTVDGSGQVSLVGSVNPAIQTITGDVGGALSPTAGNINIFTAVIAAGSTPIQRSQAALASNATKVGLSSYNSAQFTVDANGFVSLAGSSSTLTLTGNTGGPVSPTAGNINIITANTTVKFAGAASTLTQDFGLGNLVLGTSLPALTVGTKNVGMGFQVYTTLTQGSGNTAVGYQNSIALTLGANNTSVGSQSLILATTSVQNVAIGTSSLGHLTTATGSNTALGYSSLFNITTGSSNIGIGDSSGSSYTGAESSNIIIGNTGVLGESNVIRIGTQGSAAGQQNQSFIAGVFNTVSGRVVKTTSPGAYPYTTLVTDYVILVDTSSARTIIPLAAPVTGTTYRIKDSVGSAALNNITITPSGKNIDGAASYVISSNYGSIDIVYNGTEWSKF